MEENNQSLCFIRSLGMNVEGNNVYELLFTDEIDEFWGEDFEFVPCGVINNLAPHESNYNSVYQFETDINLDLIINNGCFSMQDCIDNIVALGWQNLNGLDEYPDEGRLVFHFGDTFEEVSEKLADRNILLTKKETQE